LRGEKKKHTYEGGNSRRGRNQATQRKGIEFK